MASFHTTHCCGVQELHGISYGRRDPANILKSCFTYHKEIPHCGIIFFTEAARGNYGKKLKKFIEDQKLGSVYMHQDVHNPNHPRRKTGVRMFLWNVDRPAFQEWVNKNVETKIWGGYW